MHIRPGQFQSAQSPSDLFRPGTAAPVTWLKNGTPRSALWRTTGAGDAPDRIEPVGAELSAARALRLVTRGTALLHRGDLRNARQLLDAMGRRTRPRPSPADTTAQAFHRYRRAQAERARLLGRLLVELDADFALTMPHAPPVRAACLAVYPDTGEPSLVSLRELLGVIGAHEWRRRGIEIPGLASRIHPHYGVFAPTRPGYVELVAGAELPGRSLAFDLGTGTGVLAALLCRRGVRRVLATDLEPRAVRCARDNLHRLGLSGRVRVEQADGFPAGRADLVVCNPPWLPGDPASSLDAGIYDPGGRMLGGFLHGLPAHLREGGEGWLVLSDLAELLGLRPRGELPARFTAAGLEVLGRTEIPARHPRAVRAGERTGDPLDTARAAERITLWRLAPARKPVPRSGHGHQYG